MVRLLSFFTLSLLLLSSCASKAPEPEKTEIPKPTVPKPKEDTRPVILCFGDSITAGFGLEAGETYPDVLQKLLDQKGYAYQVVNAGISGDTTQGGVDRLNDALRYEPKLALLELGGNDGLRGIPVARSRDNLTQIAARLEARGSKVVVLGITLPRNYGPDYIREFEAMYKNLALNGNRPFMPFVLQGVYDAKGMMQPDGIHPTAPGAARIAANVLKVIEPMLTK